MTELLLKAIILLTFYLKQLHYATFTQNNPITDLLLKTITLLTF